MGMPGKTGILWVFLDNLEFYGLSQKNLNFMGGLISKKRNVIGSPGNLGFHGYSWKN